ncbi:uncharacterized protein DUF4244 [Antricoccus suffuscus]|uniref:Uncharacterized protein DUF4244 n=1 Tax=Antricoccus suffuscus TaxID=1629062 RepID=A0A2T1A3C8_9ACTN|nr:DUF4244 domain-containing protein [Antricoccus suffuscus]PRZ43112.1 uncharacterized protein DUF4244 [Antricoccus suffuscus]
MHSNYGERRARQGPLGGAVRAISAAVALGMVAPLRRRDRDAGMTTAEYAVGTVAACAFAAILYQVVTGSSVVSALGSLISSALSAIS